MRYTTIRTDGATRAARLEDDAAIVLDAADVGELLRRRAAGEPVDETGDVVAVADCTLAPVVTAPGKIICVGRNYIAHIRELGHELPTHPTLFAKFASSLIGANDEIHLPEESDAMDWEAELALVVGTSARRVRGDEALAAIAGYTIANDVTARDWQFRTAQWLAGKSLDHATPIGPALVSGDEIDDAADLRVSCHVNGVENQSARTSDLLFRPRDIVEYISAVVTLEPGDLILTGTPGGVGHAMEPPQYLQPGDVVTTRIDAIGELVNSCVSK